MKTLRVLSALIIVLLVGCFSFMITVLILGNFNAFFISGGILVGLIIAGFVIKKVFQNLDQKEHKTEEQKH